MLSKTDVNQVALVADRLLNIGTDEIAEIIDVDSLGYLSVEHVKMLAGKDKGYCTACFDEYYPTETPLDTRKDRFERKISENGKEDR